MRRPPSTDDIERPDLEVRARGVLVNGYCPACGDGLTPEMELVMREDGLWTHGECAAEETEQ